MLDTLTIIVGLIRTQNLIQKNKQPYHPVILRYKYNYNALIRLALLCHEKLIS